MHGFMGLKGWQWLFLIEAIPAVLLSFVVFFYLTDRPSDATWLAADEREWLVARLDQERRNREAARHYSVAQALVNPRVLALSLVYFGAVATNYGLSFFLPQIVKAFGVSNVQAGLIAALPYVVGVVSIVLWGRRSDRKLERRFHLAFPLFIAACGIAASTLTDDPRLRMLAFSIAGFGIFGGLPVFWTFPTAFLSGPAAARSQTKESRWDRIGSAWRRSTGAASSHAGRQASARWRSRRPASRKRRGDRRSRP
jgi:sugar phosphate permease